LNYNLIIRRAACFFRFSEIFAFAARAFFAFNILSKIRFRDYMFGQIFEP